MEDIGLCLFLPRRHFLAAAPSFVEAVLGAPSEAPGREALENATALMRRLAADAAVVPLNLFGNGAGGGLASDQPDFLIFRATLPYVFSLIGGRNWKSGPGAKASPLMTEIWTLLYDGRARTAGEIQAALGRELTEAAVLRALAELWNGLRVIPAFDGELTRWELTQARFAAEMTASQKVAQTTALSALVSLYLDGAVAASPEEIETFLSPLTARSRVREVVNGLAATRQLGMVSVGAQPLLHVAGALPEFAEEESAKAEVEPRREREERAERKPYERGPRPARSEGREVPERREKRLPQRDFKGKPEKPSPKRDFNEQRERPFPKREFSDFKEKRERPGGGGFPKRKFGDSGRDRERPWHERGERPAAGEGRRPFRERREGERGAGKKFGGREKPRFFRERAGEGEAKRPFREQREGERGGRKQFGGPKKFGDGKKFGGQNKPRFFRERSGQGEGRPERAGGKKFGRPEFGGEKNPRFFRDRAGEGDARRPFREQRENERGGRKFGGGKKFGGQEKPRFFRERSSEGESRPERDKGRNPGAARGKAGFGNSGRPAFRGEGKRGFSKERKPFGKPGGNYPKKFGKPKPGGFKPPFRKKKNPEGEE